MIRFKGTDGIWTITEPGDRNGHYMVWSNKSLVAVVHGDGMAEANARLIAAARNHLLPFVHGVVARLTEMEKDGQLITGWEKQLLETSREVLNRSLR